MTDLTLMKRIADLAKEDPLLFQYFSMYRKGSISYVDMLAGAVLAMKAQNDLLTSMVQSYRTMYPPPVALDLPVHLTEPGRREVYDCPVCGSASVDVTEICDINLCAKEGNLRVTKIVVRLNCLECGHFWKSTRRIF